MRKYVNNELVQVICNNCQNELQLEKGYLKEECIGVDHLFGYFSKRDTVRHKFDLCEECYNKIISGFIIPVSECEETEVM